MVVRTVRSVLLSRYPDFELILVMLFYLSQRWAFSEPVVHLGKRPPRLMRLVSFIKGAVAGALTPVNRGAAHYYRRKADSQ